MIGRDEDGRGGTKVIGGVSDPFDSEYAWLAVAITAGLAVYAAYVATHSMPAYEGGLFLQMSEVIGTNGYRLPRRIPYYTADGVPFAYPPLMFYVAAAVLDLLRIDPVAFVRYLPGLVIVASAIPYYLLARTVLDSVPEAGLATTLFVVTPPVLQWHISAGGVVRAPAALLTILGLYTGIKLFRTHERTWLLASTILFALVVLTHPVYAVFFGTSYLLVFAAADRSLAGLLRGAVVVAGAGLLTAPWWLTVALTHGFETFLGATGTRTTLGGGGSRLFVQFVRPITALDPLTPFYVLAFAGGLVAVGGGGTAFAGSDYAANRRRYFLPAWMVGASYLLGEQRFAFFAGSMLSAVLVFEVIVPAASAVSRRQLLSIGVVAGVVVGATVVGAAFAGSALNTAHYSSSTVPQTVDSADLEAMEWTREHTSSDAQFVVLGDAAEWFPYFTERTILVTPWGTEWTGAEQFRHHLELYTGLSRCPTVTCLELHGLHSEVEGDVDYLYVPKDEYTVRGAENRQSPQMRWSLRRSDHYELAYENRDVMIFRVVSQPTGRATGPDRSGEAALVGAE